MSDEGFGRYMMSVLAYYRSEWTDVSDEDRDFSIILTKDLRRLIRNLMRSGSNVPNAAMDVRIFMEMEATRALGGHSGPFLDFGKNISKGLAELYEDWKSKDEGEEHGRSES